VSHDPIGLIAEVLARHLEPARAQELTAELRERAAGLGENLVAGVNAPRTDYGDAWEQARAAAYAPTENAGAVHLELGTWSAFPAGRVQELVDGDGLSELIRLDTDPTWEAELVADARALPLRSAGVDRIGSNSTVEHIAHPHRVIAEAHRVLKPGGVFVTAMPFVWHEHGYPEDHVRLTRGFWERVLTETGFEDVHVDRDGCSGLYYTLHQASKMAAIDTRHPEHAAMQDLQRLVTELLGHLIPLDRFFTDGAREWYQSVRVVARKPGSYEPSRRPRRADVPFAARALDLLADPQTKSPLAREGDRVVCTATGVGYRVAGTGGVNFLEPRLPAAPAGERLRDMGRRVRRRLSADR
jgi:SAM-dependent methyltransferase